MPASSKKASYQSQRQKVRAMQLSAARIPRADWELAERATRVPAYFSSSGREIQAIDIAQADYTFREPTTASNIVLLNGVQSGDAFYQRNGARITMRNLHIRGTVFNAATSTVCGLRLLIVYDRQPTGGLPTIQDILQSRTQAGVASTAAFSEINLDFRERFGILRDMQWYAPSVTNTAGVLTNGPSFPGQDNQQWDINEFIRLRELITLFKSTNNPVTIANISTGALYACFVSSVDSTYQAKLGFRLRYNDK